MRKWPFKESSVQYGIVGVERSGFGDENVTSMTRRQNHWGTCPASAITAGTGCFDSPDWSVNEPEKVRRGVRKEMKCFRTTKVRSDTPSLSFTHTQMHTYCICTFICCLFQGHMVHYAPQSLWDINKSDSETSTRDKTKHVRQQLTGCVRRK